MGQIAVMLTRAHMLQLLFPPHICPDPFLPPTCSFRRFAVMPGARTPGETTTLDETVV